MIESELGLLQMKREPAVADTVKLCQAVLGIASERFDALDMIGAPHELVVAMVDPKVLFQANAHQFVIATSAIGVNAADGIGLAPDDGLQCGFGGFGDDFGVHAVIALEQPKGDGLATGASATLTPNAPGAKVGLIGFEFTGKGRARSAVLGQTQADALVEHSLVLRTDSPDSWAASLAVKSRANKRKSRRNLASLILERR